MPSRVLPPKLLLVKGEMINTYLCREKCENDREKNTMVILGDEGWNLETIHH